MPELSEYEVLLEEYRYLHDSDPPRPHGWPSWSSLKSKGRRNIARRALYRALHARSRSALCLSGGGIRSATFALGLIQRFAEMGILSGFDYLSTVSGGGYIGSWLSSFARRDRAGMDGVQSKLSPRRRASTRPEPDELRHLREYSNYLTPHLGLLSGDTWALIGTYLRNISLLWFLLIPLFVAVLAVPRLLVSTVQAQAPDCVIWLTLVVAALSFVLALIHLGGARPVGRMYRYWWWEGKSDAKPALTDGVFLTRAILPLTICSIALALLYAWRGVSRLNPAVIGGGAAAVSIVLVLLYMVRYITATDSEARQNKRPGQSLRRYLWQKFFVELLAAGTGGVAGAIAAYYLFQWLFPLPLWHITAPSPRDWLSPHTSFMIPPSVVYVCFGVPVAILALLVDATIFIAISSVFNEEYDREWWARSGAWCLVVAVSWIAVCALSLIGPAAVYFAPRTVSAVGMITGGFAALMGRSPKTNAKTKIPEDEKWTDKVLNASLGAAVPIFAVCLFALLSLGTTKVFGLWVQPPRESQRKASPVLERTAWHYEVSKPANVENLGRVERKYKSIDLPALDGDEFAARLHFYIVEQTDWLQIVLLIAGGLLLSWLSSPCIGVNRFSMHGLYRNRLVRAFLGASNKDRLANPFSGFDPGDNLQMADLRPDFIRAEELDENRIAAILSAPATPDQVTIATSLSAATRKKSGDALRRALADDLRSMIAQQALTRAQIENALGPAIHRATKRPMHVVNMALNLVSGGQLAWQERKAESFTASPLHCGNAWLGYRPSDTYAEGLTLGTAVTISGAAASPNMGYHSSPALAFLLTFFNVRLGAWLGNPGPAGEKTYARANPRWPLSALFGEVAGRTNDSHPYVYLSDGGHFENLGLYEMVRRRCHWIVLSDAGADEKFAFEDLGNAIRKIRIDLGIDVKVHSMGIYPRGKTAPENPKYCAIAEIQYKGVDGQKARNGWLVYIKPTFYGKNEPKDIYNYATANQRFPHEPTADQFFSESQFESYRALGYYATGEVADSAQSVENFVRKAILYAKREDFRAKVRKWMGLKT